MKQFIEVENVTKRYGDFVALDDFSCSIPSGVVGILGPNGAGKTTFIRSLLGIHPFQSGRIQFLDYELPHDLFEVKDLIGYQPEVKTLINRVTAMKYVVHMCRIAGLPREAAKQRAFDTLHYVGLEEARYRPLETYSQGMLQKVKLATALVHDPLLLVLDEPTAGCDPASREQILNLIYDLGHNHGKNLLISTHLLPDIERAADYIVLLSLGKLVMQGTLTDVLARNETSAKLVIRVSGNPQKFADILESQGYMIESVAAEIQCIPKGDDGVNNLIPIFKLAKENNMDIRKITPYKLDLEEVFLDAVQENGGKYGG